MHDVLFLSAGGKMGLQAIDATDYGSINEYFFASQHRSNTFRRIRWSPLRCLTSRKTLFSQLGPLYVLCGKD
jgi:hypothetical protein